MRRAVAVLVALAAGVLVALVVGGGAGAQLPPLPIPTSTTTTTEPPPEPPPDDVEPEPPPPEEPTTTIAPEVAPIPAPVVPVVTSTTTATTTTMAPRLPPRSEIPKGPVASAIPGGFALAVGAVLIVATTLVFLASRARPGGFRMNDPRRRWRLYLAVASLVLAAVIGIVGWLKLSLEPQVNRQIPYMASAGMALVVLAAVGGSLLVAEQLRADDERIADLEDAVRRLTTTIEPLVESPPRGTRRS